MALEESGVPDSAPRFVVVHDTHLLAFHAVTVVIVEGEALVLDNRSNEVLPARGISRYVPCYSINRSGWWYHESAAPRLAGISGLP
jgi:predicted transglutaminase-like cysteine proteinase